MMGRYFNPLTWLLLALNVVLVIGLFSVQNSLPASSDAGADGDSDAATQAQQRSGTRRFQVAIDPTNIVDVEEIAARPLFDKSRRPPVEEKAAAVPVRAIPAADLRLNLEGVAMNGGIRFALIRDRQSNEIHYLKPGDTVGDYRVIRVQATSVKLDAGGRTDELSLDPSKN